MTKEPQLGTTTRLGGRGAVLLLILLAGAAGAAGPRVPHEVVDRIQRKCLRAYPDDMRAKMASGATEIPADVEDSPEKQMRFLDKELAVEKGLFYPSLLEEVLPALEPYVTQGTRFLDLGSGDGRVVFLANVLGARATGIEYDPEIAETSRRARDALAEILDLGRVSIVEGDFFIQSWSGYDVIFYFDTSSLEHQRLRQKLRDELDPRARLIVGHEIVPFDGFELEREFKNMKVYRLPAAGD